MKPFDLEAAKRGDQIVTRDGREAKFIAYVPESSSVYCVIVLVKGTIYHVTYRGIHSDTKSPSDLFMLPKTQTVWVNLYRRRDCRFFYSENDADQSALDNRLGGKAYPVEVEYE